MVHWAWVKVDTIIRFSVQIDLQQIYDWWFVHNDAIIGVCLLVAYIKFVRIPLNRRRARRWNK
jgi:hypothetical protein